MLNFPFSELSHEMKVRVLEKLSPNDAIKWMQISRELRGLVRDHGVLPKSVDKIDHRGSTTDIIVRARPGAEEKIFDLTTQAPFLSKIRFCREIHWLVLTEIRRFREPQKAAFSRILAAKQMHIQFSTADSAEFIEFLDCLRAVVTNCASIEVYCDYCPIRLNQFIETSLGDCPQIVLNFYDLPISDVRMALSKTNVQVLSIVNLKLGSTITEGGFMQSIRDILQNGIPSLHPKALVFFQQQEPYDCSVERVTRLFKDFSGIRQLNGEDLEKARELISKRFLTHGFHFSLVKLLCFLRSNDNGADVVYALQTQEYEMIFMATTV